MSDDVRDRKIVISMVGTAGFVAGAGYKKYSDKDELRLLAGDIENFLMRKGYLCTAEVK